MDPVTHWGQHGTQSQSEAPTKERWWKKEGPSWMHPEAWGHSTMTRNPAQVGSGVKGKHHACSKKRKEVAGQHVLSL